MHADLCVYYEHVMYEFEFPARPRERLMRHPRARILTVVMNMCVRARKMESSSESYVYCSFRLKKEKKMIYGTLVDCPNQRELEKAARPTLIGTCRLIRATQVAVVCPIRPFLMGSLGKRMEAICQN